MATTCAPAVGCLLNAQRSDGGWAFGTHSSWTEPTGYSIMALRVTVGVGNSAIRACEWLARRQRRDGGWSPGPEVDRSTHVTSLAVLALSGLTGYEDVTDRGIGWLLGQSGAETRLWARMARFVMGMKSSSTGHAGWPWFPGAAAWVIPTSLAICALNRYRADGQKDDKRARAIEARVEDARRFLLSRRCPDYGWNHGGLFRPDETPVSYPETTGIALMALASPRNEREGQANSLIERSITCAERHALDPKSGEGANWLQLGLAAHGRAPATSTARYRDWTVTQVALRIIAQSIAQNGESGRNPFIDHV